MDDLNAAIDRALRATQNHPAHQHVQRAAQLARFQARELDGPFHDARLSDGVPQPPQRPLVDGDDPISKALDELQYQLVWAADCAEFSDATNNARQYLQAAGHVDLAVRAVRGPAGAEGARYVRDLAAALGLDLSTCVPAMGMLPPNRQGVLAVFRWDIHHEAPISDPERLGARELTRYSVPLPDGRILAWETPKRVAKPLNDRLNSVSTPEELAALAPVRALELANALDAHDAFAQTVDVHMSSWELTTPQGPLTLGDWTIAARLDGRPTGADLDVHIPAGRAMALGAEDVVISLRVR